MFEPASLDASRALLISNRRLQFDAADETVATARLLEFLSDTMRAEHDLLVATAARRGVAA